VIIIDEVHMLTREAFNALLKTLEEPPPHTIFIFATTEFHKVPATIVSRCQHFEFKKISHKEIINHLLDITQKEKITISSYGLNLIADAADGSLRDAQSLLDQAVSYSGENISDEDLKEILGAVSREILFAVSQAILNEKPDRVFSLVDTIMEKGYDLRFFYKELIQHFRDLLLVKSVQNPGKLLALDEDDIAALEKEAGQSSADDFLQYLVVLQQGEQGLKFSSHPRIYLEALLVKLCHFKKITPLKDILKEIDSLKGDLKKHTGGAKPPTPLEPLTHPEEETQNSQSRQSEDLGGHKEERIQPHAPEKKKEGFDVPPPDKKPPTNPKKKKQPDSPIKDPTVQSFLDTFKAQVLSVEPIKKGKTDDKI